MKKKKEINIGLFILQSLMNLLSLSMIFLFIADPEFLRLYKLEFQYFFDAEVMYEKVEEGYLIPFEEKLKNDSTIYEREGSKRAQD